GPLALTLGRDDLAIELRPNGLGGVRLMLGERDGLLAGLTNQLFDEFTLFRPGNDDDEASASAMGALAFALEHDDAVVARLTWVRSAAGQFVTTGEDPSPEAPSIDDEEVRRA